MSNQHKPPLYKGRSFGITVLAAAQLFIGVIHTFFGVLLFVSEDFSTLAATAVYDIYTLFYGLLVLVFAVFFWQGKRAGWIGTVAVSLFVIAADSLTVLNLPSVPGIPKGAAVPEIAYSIIVIVYLVQAGIRKKYLS